MSKKYTLELSNHEIQDILDDLGMIDENGNCPYTAEEIFRASMEWINLHSNLSEEEQVGMGGLGMIWQKNHLIEKACEWLKENIDIYAKVVINPKSHYPEIVMCDSFEKSFKKAMEE